MQTAVFRIHLQVIRGFAPGGSMDFYLYKTHHSAAAHYAWVRYGDVQKEAIHWHLSLQTIWKPFFFPPKLNIAGVGVQASM